MNPSTLTKTHFKRVWTQTLKQVMSTKTLAPKRLQIPSNRNNVVHMMSLKNTRCTIKGGLVGHLTHLISEAYNVPRILILLPPLLLLLMPIQILLAILTQSSRPTCSELGALVAVAVQQKYRYTVMNTIQYIGYDLVWTTLKVVHYLNHPILAM